MSAGRFFSIVATSSMKESSPTRASNVESTTRAGVQSALACAAALQFAWQSLSVAQPPPSVPPAHEIARDDPPQFPEQITLACPGAGAHVESHCPVQSPSQEIALASVHVPLHMP